MNPLRIKPYDKFTLSFCAKLAAEPVEPLSAQGPLYLASIDYSSVRGGYLRIRRGDPDQQVFKE